MHVLIDDAIVQTRAALIDKHGVARIALSGLTDGPIAGAVLDARLTKRLSGHGDCLITLSDGTEAHLSARRGGTDPVLTEGTAFLAEIVRGSEDDKRPEVRVLKQPQVPASDWDEIDQFLTALPPDFSGDIHVGTPQLWQARVPAWQNQFPTLSALFKQDFRGPGALLEHSGADDCLLSLMAQRQPLTRGGDMRFGSVSGITVFDVNSGTPTGQTGALKTNLMAAQALPRLLTLGHFGGLMVVDFIDLKRQGDQKTVLDTFDAACAASGLSARRTNWSKFGMIELQTARSGPDLSVLLRRNDGAGYHAPTIAMRAIEDAAQRRPGPMVLKASIPVADWLSEKNGAQTLSERLAMPVSLAPMGGWPSERWALNPA